MRVNSLKLIFGLVVLTNAVNPATMDMQFNLRSDMSNRSASTIGTMDSGIITYGKRVKRFKELSELLFLRDSLNIKAIGEEFTKLTSSPNFTRHEVVVNAMVDLAFLAINNAAEEKKKNTIVMNFTWFLLNYAAELGHEPTTDWKASFTKMVGVDKSSALLELINNCPNEAILNTEVTPAKEALLQIFKSLSPIYASSRNSPTSETFKLFENLFGQSVKDCLLRVERDKNAALIKQIEELRSRQNALQSLQHSNPSEPLLPKSGSSCCCCTVS